VLDLIDSEAHLWLSANRGPLGSEFKDWRPAMRKLLTPMLGLVLAGTIAATSALALPTAGPRSGPISTVPEVLGYGHQNPEVPKKFDLFGIFAIGSSNTATGTMSVWVGNPRKWRTGPVTCVQTNGNDSIITGMVVSGGEIVIQVAEVVDNSDPSDPSQPDMLRFSYAPDITPTGTEGCWEPVLGPLSLRSGDIRIDGP
jgi:hypothetical protein